ncbi:hypothetical protein [Pseudonocardia xinjiangensis]|uniref:Uncharacterized protein n=1 Tax=Pseudonocardia xinjiangensis TaxID=75289 RepID=A0ABX1R7A1_9PSEU|nr:hypothetical protein [Pseudonocardia xinjiangensis]NMH75759.1 hypothetical protein [Pseudonocardia xinjiangensis]
MHAQQPVGGRQPARYATGSNDGSVGSEVPAEPASLAHSDDALGMRVCLVLGRAAVAEQQQCWQISHRLQSMGLHELGQHRHPVNVLEGRLLQEREIAAVLELRNLLIGLLPGFRRWRTARRHLRGPPR